MKFWFLFLLVFVLGTLSLGYATEGEADTLPEGFPSSVESLEQEDVFEPVPDIPGPTAETDSEILAQMEMLRERLDKIISYWDIFTYILVPFTFAFFICWHLAKWFYTTFIKR